MTCPTKLCGLLTVMILALAQQAAMGQVPEPPHGEAGKLQFETYSGYFVSNKFEPDAAESFVVFTEQDQFDQTFGAAFVMGDKSHRLAKNAFQSDLVLAAIKRGAATWEFKVQGVVVRDALVELRYAATAQKSDTGTFAVPLIVSIPKGRYTAVQFVENGKPAKRIELVETRDVK